MFAPEKAREWQKCHSLLLCRLCCMWQASARERHRQPPTSVRGLGKGVGAGEAEPKTLSEFVEEV